MSSPPSVTKCRDASSARLERPSGAEPPHDQRIHIKRCGPYEGSTNAPLTTAASLLRPRRRRAHCPVQLATVRSDVLMLEAQASRSASPRWTLRRSGSMRIRSRQLSSWSSALGGRARYRITALGQTSHGRDRLNVPAGHGSTTSLPSGAMSKLFRGGDELRPD